MIALDILSISWQILTGIFLLLTFVTSVAQELKGGKPRTKKGKIIRSLIISSTGLLCITGLSLAYVQNQMSDAQSAASSHLQNKILQSNEKIADQNSTIVVLIDDLRNMKIDEFIKTAAIKKQELIANINTGTKNTKAGILQKIRQEAENAKEKFFTCQALQEVLAYKTLKLQAEIDGILTEDEQTDQSISDRLKALTPELIQKLDSYVQ